MRQHCCINKQSIKELRLAKGMTIEQLSQTTGICADILYKAEGYAFRMSVCDTLAIADALEVDIHALLLEKPKPSPGPDNKTIAED